MISSRSVFIPHILCLLCVLGYTSIAQTVPLSSWTFKQSTSTKWLPAQVPGTVHTDLLRNKIIKDPFLDDNEKKVQWVGEANWDYQSKFSCDDSS